MKLLPGLVLVALISVIAQVLNAFYQPLSAVLIAVLLGVLLKNTAGVRKEFQPGAKYAVKSILKLAIILLGVRLSFYDLINLGVNSLWIIVTCILLALSLTTGIAKWFKLPPRLGTLIAVGTAICGNSAAIATAGAIEAEEEEVAFAVGTITLFGVLAIIIYPLIGKALALSDLVFGTWAGTAINDTAQVVTAGFLYSNAAGEVATVVKLTRNLFIAPVVFFFSVIYAMGKARSEQSVNYVAIFPWFVLGFLGMAMVRTTGILPAAVISFLKETADFLILIAVAGIGLGLDLKAMKKLGFKAFYTGLFASTVMGLVSFFLVTRFI